MMGVTAYRQLLRSSKMRSAGAAAPEESAAALQHVRLSFIALCSKHTSACAPLLDQLCGVPHYFAATVE